MLSVLAEVLIHARGAHLVVARDGRKEGIRVKAGVLGQLLERLALDDGTALDAALRNLRDLLAQVVIERVVRMLAAVGQRQQLRGILAGLVLVALAVLVHAQAVVGALGLLDRAVVLLEHVRQRVEGHIVLTRRDPAGVDPGILEQLRARGLRHADAVAGIADAGDAGHAVNLGQNLGHHLRVGEEAAAREDDGVAVNLDLAVFARRLHADDLAVLDDQVMRGRAGHDGRALLGRGLRKMRHQTARHRRVGIAVDLGLENQHARVLDRVGDLVGDAELLLPGAQRVARLHEHRAQTLIIRVDALAIAAGVFLFLPARERRIQRVRHIADLEAVLRKLGHHVVAGRGLRVAAGHRQLLHQEDLRAVVGRGQRRGHAAHAAADHDDVRLIARHLGRGRRLLHHRAELLAQAGLLDAVLRAGEDRGAGHGRARHAVHEHALRLENLAGELLNGDGAHADGLLLAHDGDIRHLSVFDGDAHAHLAAKALLNRRIRLSERAARQQHRQAQQQCHPVFLHGICLLSFF